MPDIKDLLLHALSLERSGQLEDAEKLCREIVAAKPSNLPALILLGRTLRKQGRLADAENRLKEAYSLSPDTPQVLAELGLLSLAKPDPAAAIVFYGKLVQTRPGDADAQFNLGHALEQEGRHQEAIDHFRNSIALGSKDEHEVHIRIGSSQLMTGDIESAVSHFDTALAMRPDFAPAYFGRGMAEAALGDLAKAESSFREAVRFDPGLTEAWQQIAESKKFTASADPDLAAMQGLLADLGDNDFALEKLHFALGKANDDLGNYDSAFHHYQLANEAKRTRLPACDPHSFEQRVDDIIRVFDYDRIAAEDVEPGGKPQYIFVVGMPRSGTTLIEQILVSHSSIMGAGENPCLEQMVRTHLAPYPDSLAEPDPSLLNRVRDIYHTSVPATAKDSPAITDKYPANYMHCGLVRILFPNAKIVHSRRNAADTCLSIYFQDFPTGNHYANDLTDIAAFYKQYQRLMNYWNEVIPDALCEIDYEKLIEDLEGQSRRLIDFVDLPWEDVCLRYQNTQREVSTLSRWQVRQPIYGTSVARWKNYEKHIQPLLDALKE